MVYVSVIDAYMIYGWETFAMYDNISLDSKCLHNTQLKFNSDLPTNSRSEKQRYATQRIGQQLPQQ